ncbi:rhomboid family-domain-containing protein [Sporodiniella umbellata]|nr:rhomboid family-domain-containing protein [Sporodiniella umbellata]
MASPIPPPVPDHSTHVIDAHEMQQRNGFQKLNSFQNQPESQNQGVYTPQNNQTYYNAPSGQQYGPSYGGQPYYYGTPPPTGQHYPLLTAQQQTTLPNGYDRHPLLRLLIGPISTPVFTYLSGIAMAAMLIYEFVTMHNLTGEVIATNPFNVMIGPSFQVLVNIGARFTPCIRSVPSFPPSTLIADCYGSVKDTCTVESLCGYGGFPDNIPNQSFRLIVPIFMHAGVVHFLMNMLTHCRLGADLERTLGTPRYVLLYMASGIYGFVLSAMLSQNMSASTGCSGALFGLIGYMFIDIMVNWKFLPFPMRDLMGLLISTIISLVLGLLPGLDNFAHVGGFAIGILMGMVVAPMRPMPTPTIKALTWVMRVVALAGLVVLFAVSIHQFYAVYDTTKICPNCKYFSCLPVRDWCDR